MSTVVNAIRKGDARLAWKLLESQGITTPPKTGSTDVHELQRREALERRKHDVAERKERVVRRGDSSQTLMLCYWAYPKFLVR